MSTTAQNRFVEALRVIECTLGRRGFIPAPPLQHGFATWISFKKPNCEVKFAYGPPEYHVEMFIRMETKEGAKNYELADLMRIPSLAQWISDNRPVSHGDDSLCIESRWFAELLNVALPELER
jgi:hypothetical protein